MLKAAKTGAGKTRIMHKANLSYTQLTGYLYYLQQNGLITHEADTQIYRPTEKGLKFLNLSNKLSKMTPAQTQPTPQTQPTFIPQSQLLDLILNRNP
jgi:predicted transcriptional regulator